jgi:protein-arginine kinase activator protein McsA
MQTQTERETVRKKEEEQNSAVKPEEARSQNEVCNFCSAVTETFEVLSLFGDTHCYIYSKIKSVIINCNSPW